MGNKGELYYLNRNYCCRCRRWHSDKSVLVCPVCNTPMRLGNGASHIRHGIKISGITGKVVRIPGVSA